jgi:hypothetical protein
LAFAAANEHYRRAIQTHEFTRQVELRAELIRVRAALPRIPQPPAPTSADDDIMQWLDADAAAKELERRRNDNLESLNKRITQTELTIQSHATNRDRVIGRLAKDLPALVEAARDAVQRLDGATTPAEAIRLGRADQWNELDDDHADALDNFYSAYDFATAGAPIFLRVRSDYLEDDYLTQARIRNIHCVLKHWKRPTVDQHVQQWSQPDPLPWPAGDRASRLVWLLTRGAELWAPAPRELRELQQELIAETAHPNGVTPQQHTERQVLNEAPRDKPDYTRIAAPIEQRQKPELAELGATNE